jgi:hypothetical protein
MPLDDPSYSKSILHMALEQWPLTIISPAAAIPLRGSAQRLNVHPDPKEQDGLGKLSSSQTIVSGQAAHCYHHPKHTDDPYERPHI